MFDTIFKLYKEEVNDLNLGRDFSQDRLNKIWEIIQEFDFLACGNPTDIEENNILNKYE